MAQQKANVFYQTLPSAVDLQLVKAVIRYEAAVRRLTLGQACFSLVTEAADVDSYPAEVRKRIDDIELRRREHAISSAITGIRHDNVA